MSDPIDALEAFCARHDLPWSDEKRETFTGFLGLLQQFNKAMNLIGPMSDHEVVETLFIDSVSPACVVPPTGAVLDVGSGAGLPGVPLSILYPEVDFTLVEPREKRTRFLTIAKNRLKLENVEIVRARIENIPEARYDWVISKAFQPPPIWVETASQWTTPDGHVMVMHSAVDTAAMDEAAANLNLTQVGRVDDVTSLGVKRTSVQRSLSAFT